MKSLLIPCVWFQWRRKWQLTPVFLPGESHGQRSLAGYSLCGSKRKEAITGFKFLIIWRKAVHVYQRKLYGIETCIISCKKRITSLGSMQDTGYRMLAAGALGWPREMVWGGRWEVGSGLETRVHPWQIHVDVWQNQYSIEK